VAVDVPRRDRVLLMPDNDTVDGSRDKHLPPGDAVRGVHEPSHVHRDEDSSHSLGVVFLGATLGVATVLAALLVAVVLCFVVAGRRRRRKRLAKRADTDPTRPLPLPPLNDHMDTTRRAPNNHYVSTSSLQARCTTPQQPVPPTRKDSRTSAVQVSAAASPKPYRSATTAADCSCATLPSMICSAATCPSTFNTMMNPASTAGVDDSRYLAQRRAAWDAIRQRQGNPTMLLPDVPDSTERPLSMSELPPPPDFLLENAGPEVQLMRTGGKVFDTGPLMFEVGDGYRSADSVDDDIDDVDYTIRQPPSSSLLAQPPSSLLPAHLTYA